MVESHPLLFVLALVALLAAGVLGLSALGPLLERRERRRAALHRLRAIERRAIAERLTK